MDPSYHVITALKPRPEGGRLGSPSLGMYLDKPEAALSLCGPLLVKQG